MLTLFTVPKAFQGHINVIQRNAIQSWLQLRPACEIILLGDDAGVAETAGELGVKHIPQVTRSDYGTPLLDSIFDLAQNAAAYPLLAYVNADIILLNDFIAAIQQVTSNHFLMVGRRHDLDLTQTLDFRQAGWETDLRTRLAQNGVLHAPTGIDYFVFPKGAWQSIPPFALGRTVWDNWLIYAARAQKMAVIDATPMVTAVHQNHNYAHIPGGHDEGWKGTEAQRNMKLAGGKARVFTIQDATHTLGKFGVKQVRTFYYLQRYLQTLPVFYPQFRWPLKALAKIVLGCYRRCVQIN